MVAPFPHGEKDHETRLVRVGGLSKSELLGRLQDADVLLNEAARRLFSDARFITSPESSIVQAVQMSVAALGFPEGAMFSELVAGARSRGLQTCPLELGPHLRLQFPEQAEGAVGQAATRGCAPPGSVTVASEPLAEDDETPRGFYVRRIEGKLWLRGYRSWPGHRWSPQDVVMFCVP